MSLEIRDAGLKGKGVFATRAFAAADPIIESFDGPVVARRGLESVSAWEREHLAEVGIGRWRILPAPRCYLNHACDPNAVSTEHQVIALRDIVPDEEITIDYRLNAYDDGAGPWVMRCECDPARGPHEVIGTFLSLAPEAQQRYLRWAPPFIRELYARNSRS